MMLTRFLVLVQCCVSLSEAVSLMHAIGSDNFKAIRDALDRQDGINDLNKIGGGGQTPLMHAGTVLLIHNMMATLHGYIALLHVMLHVLSIIFDYENLYIFIDCFMYQC
jgi:uncharacterized ferritin-like protein (DUF455 family)